jgi:protein involved in polysaccharide export with SLBB domain
MGPSIPLFLTRAVAIALAGMLLFAAFGHAHAADTDGSYGLKRFPGDNYDSVPATAAYPAAPTPSAYTPAPSLTPAPASDVPAGYYPALNPGVTPQVTVSPPPQQAFSPPPDPAGYGYRTAPSDAPAIQPQPQAYQPPASAEPYGYKPVGPTAPAAYPAPRLASASPTRGDPYAYYQQQGGVGGRDADYVLGAGDKLRLIVFGETDLSGEFTIDGSGTVRLPLIGQVHAAGYTGPQLEAVIGSALAQGYLKSPRVAVEISTYRPFYIIGAVNRPGQYAYVDHMNALNAVALAGGFNTTAVESVVFLRREGSNEEIEVPADRTTTIHPGDVIKVHNTIFSDAVSLLSPFSGVAASAATAAVIQ